MKAGRTLKEPYALARLKYALAGLVMGMGIAITPWLKHLAYLERGYQAVGGEYAPLIFSFVMAVLIVQSLGRVQEKYRRKERQAGENHDNMPEMRAEAEKSQFDTIRVWEGMCIKDESSGAGAIVRFPGTFRKEARYKFYAVMLMERAREGR